VLHTAHHIIMVPFPSLHKVRFNNIKVAYLNHKELICMMSRHHAIWAPPLFTVYTVTLTVTDYISIVTSSLWSQIRVLRLTDPISFVISLSLKHFMNNQESQQSRNGMVFGKRVSTENSTFRLKRPLDGQYYCAVYCTMILLGVPRRCNIFAQ
jgi:hypothetical protein